MVAALFGEQSQFRTAHSDEPGRRGGRYANGEECNNTYE